MTEARATQGIVLALAEADAAARATQVLVYALGQQGAPARATQAVVLALGLQVQPARATQVTILALASSVPCGTYRCRCFKLTRLDGIVFAYTDHDEDVISEGVTYKHCSSLSASATQTASEADATGDTQITGLFSDEDITQADLFAGKFDGAKIEIFEVSWNQAADPLAARRLAAGVLGRAKQGQGRFMAEALSYGGLLQQHAILETVTPHCRFELFDARCKLNRASFLVTGSVDGLAIVDAFRQQSYRIFQDSSRAEADGYFDVGKITWLTGDNAGLSSEIKRFEAGVFTLWEPLPFQIALGDTYEATPGCDFLKTTCINKFNNVINFGGFDDVPGTDAIGQTPNAKQ